MRRKKVEDLSKMDIKHLKEDVETLKQRQNTFKTLGIVFAVLAGVSLIGTILLAVGVYLELKDGNRATAAFLFTLFDSLVGSLFLIFVAASITFFVLKGTMLEKKIAKRNRIIENYEEIHRNEKVEKEIPNSEVDTK